MDTVINMSTKHPALLHPEGLSEKNATAQDPPGDTPRPGRGPPESMLKVQPVAWNNNQVTEVKVLLFIVIKNICRWADICRENLQRTSRWNLSMPARLLPNSFSVSPPANGIYSGVIYCWWLIIGLLLPHLRSTASQIASFHAEGKTLLSCPDFAYCSTCYLCRTQCRALRLYRIWSCYMKFRLLQL